MKVTFAHSEIQMWIQTGSDFIKNAILWVMFILYHSVVFLKVSVLRVL